MKKKIEPKKEIDPKFNELVNEFDKYFKGRIISRKNINYLIKYFDRNTKTIQVMLLYDSNGIKVDEKYHDTSKLYDSIDVKDLFENAYILSKEESGAIMKDYMNDNKHYMTIYYQLQYDKTNSFDK